MKGSKPRAAALLLVAAFLLVACFSEHEAAGPGDDDLCASSRPNVVRIQNFNFVPEVLTVAAGTEVTWVNCDLVVHTSTSDDQIWNSGGLGQNVTFTYEFTEAGEYPYFCIPHANSMRARVVVQ